MASRPNILFLMSDEHRADVAGFAGDAVVKTPVLDDLADSGVVFTNAYTASPICIPGRQAMMAGQYPRTCQCERFGDDLAPGHMTFARRLAQYGYRTAAAGKLHHTGADQMQGWTHRVGMDASVTPRNIADRDETSYANRPDPTRHKWSIHKEIRRAGVGRSPHWVRDSYTVAGALNCIDEHFISSSYDRADPEIPLLLKVSLIQPHYPFLAARQDRFDYYLNRVQPFADQHPFDHPLLGGERFIARPGIEVSDRECRRAVAAYYAMIEDCDTAFGVVLEALRHAGQDLDDWIVIYTSDHGEMLGEHAVWYKSRFFEAAARVPLIIRYPRHFRARTVNENVSLCDLFATLCELADVPTPEGLDSRSLAGLLGGDSSSWPDEAVSQFDGTQLMIKRGHLKYQHYGSDAPEVLFDLQRDPKETANVINSSEHARSVDQFRRRRSQLGF